MKFLISLLYFLSIEARIINPIPISTFHTQNSILKNNSSDPLWIGFRSRLATCSDVCFSPDGKYLVAIQLLNPTVSVYEFQEGFIKPLYQITSEEGLTLEEPEKILFSPSGKTIVIPSKKKVSFFNFEEGIFNPNAYLTFSTDNIVHDAAFSNDEDYFAYITIGTPGKLHLLKKTSFGYQEIQKISFRKSPLKPKSIAFTKDCQYLAVGFSINGGNKSKPKSCLSILSINPISKKINTYPICEIPLNSCIESLTFSSDEKMIYFTDQAFDRVYCSSFDKTNGNISPPFICLQNPDSNLSFPHGLNFSRDGNYLAVSNYGDDKITIYQVIE